MRKTSLVPEPGGLDVTVHLVLDDFGRLGRSYRETDEGKADLESLIGDMLGGQFNKPVRIIAFNPGEGWARDVSEDVAREVHDRAQREVRSVPEAVKEFVEEQIGAAV